MTNAIFYGLGSIGQRHMRLLKTYFPEVAIYHWNRQTEYFEILVDDRGWRSVPYLPAEEIPNSIAFICSPTETHLGTALACAEMGLSLFIEKPVDVCSALLDQVIEVAQKKDLHTYVAYPLRYHPFITHLSYEDLETVEFICHTNSAKWPSARKLNHVVWELSHELDLSQYLLGGIRGIRGNCSPDGFRAEITCDHAGGAVSCVSLNMASTEERRLIRIHGQDYPIQIHDLIYLDQLCHFLEGVTDNSLEEAAGLFRQMEAFVGNSGNDLR